MSYSSARRQQLTQELIAAISALSATDFELLGHEVAQLITGAKLRHRGLTARRNPSGYSVDSYSHDARVVAEYGTEPEYFEADLSKPKRDLAHARQEAPHVESVLLLSSQVAGQKAMLDVASWLDGIRSETGITVDVCDARDVADFILDDILPSGKADLVAPYLEPIARLQLEEAASHQMPAPRPGAIRRPSLETRIQRALDSQRVVLLSGISGLGKTEMALAIAALRKPHHDRVVWVQSPQLSSAAQLEAVDVGNVGLFENVRGMLSTRSVFLVLDDLRSDGSLSELLEQLTDACGPAASVIVTAQDGTSAQNDIQMEFLDRIAARELLEQEVSTACPEDLFEEIWKTVNGHPLTLQLLNASARERGGWDDVRLDVTAVGELPVQDQAATLQTLANRLVARVRDAAGPALALFAWMGRPRVHADFARVAVTPSIVRALKRFRFVASDVPDTLRLHDVIWSSVNSIKPPLEIDAEKLANALHGYIRALGDDDAGTLALNHIARLHQSLLHDLVQSGQVLDGHLYAWLHHLGPGTIGVADLPDAVARADLLLAEGAAIDDFAVQVTVELAEATVRLAKAATSQDDLDVSSLLTPFHALLGSSLVSRAAKHHATHHYAKALKRLGRAADAVASLETLLKEAPIAASRLLLARTLTEPPSSYDREDAGTVAKELLTGLLDEAAASPDKASVSVVLAAAELLRRHVLGVDLEAAVKTYHGLLAPMIVGASERGLEQGVLAFAALGAAWLRYDSDQCLRIYRALPLPAVDAMEQNEREAWGELLSVLAEKFDGLERHRMLEQALEFFRAAKSRYGDSHAADVLVRLSRPRDAIATIEARFDRDNRAREDAWLMLRLSDAQAAVGADADALASAQAAGAKVRPGERQRSRFVELLASRLEAVGRRNEAARVRAERLTTLPS